MIKHCISSVFFLIILILFFGSFRNENSIKYHSNYSIILDSFPKPVGFVNDFEGVLTDKEEAQLGSMVMDVEKQTGAQIAIVSIDNYNPSPDLASYSIGLFNTWGIGNKNKNDGVLILFSKGLREIRISTGIGIEDKLTNVKCQNIIDEFILPPFKNGNFYVGLVKAIEAIKRELI